MKVFTPFSSIILIILLGVGCTQSVPNTYITQIQKHRDNIDLKFQNVSTSPLTKDSIASFSGLNYYPIDEQWNIHASFQEWNTEEIIYMATTTDRMMQVIVAGKINFHVKGAKQTLTAYRYLENPASGLFIPFLDQTNGDETYGGGRYVETHNPTNDSVWIDFNMAYNPYCCYNDNYSCPIPPLSNLLEIEIIAGEKTLYHH